MPLRGLLAVALSLSASACFDDRGQPCREACDKIASCHLDGGPDLDCGNGCARLVNYECETCVSINSCQDIASGRAGCPCQLRDH